MLKWWRPGSVRQGPKVAEPDIAALLFGAQCQVPRPVAAVEASPPTSEVTPTITYVTVPSPPAPRYRTPPDLEVTRLPVKRALVIGSCLSDILVGNLGQVFEGIAVDHILYNHAGALPPEPPQPIEEYEFQVVMLPLRTAMFESFYFRLGFHDVAGHAAAFETARERVQQMLDGALAYRDRRPIVTFVANYLVPQQNTMGRLLPRYDLRNPVHFVERLNAVIAEELAAHDGVHLLDIDEIAANFGRKYIQDDLIWANNHASFISDYDTLFDQHRLERQAPISTVHPVRVDEYVTAISHEIRAMLRSLRQIDQVKLVIVDLDDTLWRGVVADDGLDRPMVTEGWPSGFAEALAYLKKRGVLLAIVSKNSEERIRELWPDIYGGRLNLEDFAAIRINWQPKADNVESILADMNLLPHSVVFIDDNPVERAHVAQAFPRIRLLGHAAYEMRRVLMWGAEVQVAQVSAESGRRTEMIQAQVQRESERVRLTRPEFLETLGVRIRIFLIGDVRDQRFARCLELINKSNQFNTTGRRWTAEECPERFTHGLRFFAFEVDDRFTQYGVVGVAVTRDHLIEQFVMSCRVVGLEVEVAVIAALVARMQGDCEARMIHTSANFLCRDLYARCGFTETEGGWHKSASASLASPAHVRELALFNV